jgi:phenylacetate-coenzyme A ligase PaaK-like adenylate-forming protein
MLSELLITLAKSRELKRNEVLSRQELETVKIKKFRKLVRYANARSPYYAAIIKDRAIDLDTCFPGDFPVMTKTMLMANFDRILTDRRITKQTVADFLSRSTDPLDLLFDAYHVLHTSGSSGEVGYFVYSQKDWARGMSAGMRGRDLTPEQRKKIGRRKFRVGFYGAVGGHFAGVSMASSAKRGMAKWFVDMEAYEINTPLPEVIAALNQFQPDYLAGYTTAMKVLAVKQREGVLRIAPLRMEAGGEGMTLEDKRILEEAFGCTATSRYGCTEHLMMGMSNPDGATMTLFDDDLTYEFFDDHSLVTNLFNYTLPLIRYRISDILRPITPQNPSSPYIVIDSLVGRTEKVPAFLNRDGEEDFISPHTINEIFVAGIVRFQMRLIDKTRFQFAVILDSALNAQQRAEAVAATERRLREVLDQKQMNNVTFEVTPVDDLPLDVRTRKFRLIVDALAA